MKPRRLNLPWRQPELERGPLVLGYRRLYILPTRAGLAFAALCIGVLIAASNYSISLGYLFSFLLMGLGMAGLLHTHRNLLGLTLRPSPVMPVYAGEPAVFRLQVENPDRHMRGAVRLSRADQAGEETDIAGPGEAELEIDLAQPRRGYHLAGTLTLSTTWPLGLFRCWTVFALDWGALVYPKPAAGNLPLPFSSAQGTGKTGNAPGDDEFYGLRSYQPGDRPSRISWKSVARGQPPLTKQFAEMREDSVHIDWHSAPEQDTEARLSRLTRWVLDAERSGQPWSLTLPGLHLPPGRGDSHLKQALESLARHDAS